MTGTPRDPSPSSTLAGPAVPTQPTTTHQTSTPAAHSNRPRAASGERSIAQTATATDLREKANTDEFGEKDEESSSTSSKEYEERGVIEVDQDGTKRKLKVVVEDKSGREQFKDVQSGPYSEPRW